jgi:hypothetical protein
MALYQCNNNSNNSNKLAIERRVRRLGNIVYSQAYVAWTSVTVFYVGNGQPSEAHLRATLYNRDCKFQYLVLKNPPFYALLADNLFLFVRIFLFNSMVILAKKGAFT